MIAIIAGCGSNIASVQGALMRLGYKAQLTTDPDVIVKASHVILPGVGHAQLAMRQLAQHQLVTLIPQLTQPLLGICLGMQLLFTHSMEGDVDCLGIIPGTITPLQPKPYLSIPHMGWNTLDWQQSSPLQHGIDTHDRVYFVHSFAAPINSSTIASCEHGQSFSAIVAHRNFFGMQFHPERSGVVGERLLAHFLAL